MSEAEYFEVNVQGTSRLVEACLRAGVRSIVYVSSLAAQGPSPDGRAEDPKTVTPHPLSTYGKSKLAGEWPVLSAAEEMKVAVARLPVIYGPRDRGLLPFFRLIKYRLMPMFSDGSHRLSWIYASDAADSVLAMTATGTPTGAIYTACDGESYSWHELVDLLAHALKRQPLRLGIPRPAYAFAGHAAGLGSRLARRPLPLSREKVREMEQRYWVCSNDAITGDLGWTPRVSGPEGVALTLAWYRGQRWL
jgi:nucleoside-diphosphate-sugar epimerase